MTIEINDMYEEQLFRDIVEFLKSCGYKEGEYCDNSIISKILNDCFNYLCDQLTAEIKEFKNPKDIYFFLHYYDHQEAKEDTIIIFKDICRHIFAYMPFLKLTEDGNTILTPNKISRLWFISKGLRHISQSITLSKIFEGNTFYFYITDKIYNITFQNERVANIIEAFCKANRLGLRKHYCDDFSIQKAFIDGVIDFFAPVSQSLWDAVITNNPNRNIYIEGVENLSEDEFMSILNGLDNSIPKGVVRVTSLVNSNRENPFIASLILDKSNANLKQALISPHKESFRPRYKPIIEVSINNETEYITTGDILFEALSEIATAQFVHNKLPDEWNSSQEFKSIADSAFHSHSKLLEKTIAELLEINGFKYLLNVENVNGIDLNKNSTTFFLSKRNQNFIVGEIDFIIINHNLQTIFVVDAKFLKPRNHFQGYYADINSFIKPKGYNDKMSVKVGWIRQHLTDLNRHCRDMSSSIEGYNVVGAFVTDNLTFYSLFSEYPIIPAVKFIEFIKTGNSDYLHE